jgi:REP-associated tyrosine transposase
MKYDPQRHHRHSIRMQGHDYSLAGAYFITVITYQREMLFGEIVDGQMKLNRRGEIVREEWFASLNIRKEIRLFPDEFVVMPNHIHGIVWIVENRVLDANDVGANGRSPLRNQPYIHMKPKSLSSFIAGFKSSVTKRIRDELHETGIWQRNFHDRIIRNDRELNAIRNYIEANPRNWAEDDENPILGK